MGTPCGQGNMEKSAYIFYASRQESLCQKTLILVPVLKVFNDLYSGFSVKRILNTLCVV